MREWGRRVVLTVLVLALACDRTPPTPALFESLSPAVTGVTFVNELPETPEINIINYLNFYNGGGVAAGDIDNDNLPDLYFTSNLGSDRLYRNLGNYQFEDITEQAGMGETTGWKTGVTMADVNGDGYLDIHVSTVTHLTLRGANALYINSGDGTFTDRAEELGIAHVGYSTQAAFFDYDADGDLDLYLLNHSTHEARAQVWNPAREERHSEAGDRLFRNDGNRFVDVSQEAGIYGGVEGYGLGVVVSDLNVDGCPDIFVANDFHENDFLYFNNCDGTFTESIATATGHTSFSSMGVDAADFTNDGRPDLVVLDMFPEREDILKTSANGEDLQTYQLKLASGLHPQFARNTLQLNRGAGRFSEIAYLAGVHATDWSWAALFADLENDGDKDLFVTNGIYRRPNDLDYINYLSDRRVQESLRSGPTQEELAAVLEKMPQVAIANYAFRNNGDLTFTNNAKSWGVDQREFSTGAVYVDLNNTGALDLVINNINAPARILRNRSRDINDNHYLSVRLRGTGANTTGVGARVVVGHGGTLQMQEQMPTRGFQSAVDHRLHFGLGPSSVVDSVLVIWPDRRYQVIYDAPADRQTTLDQADASGKYEYQSSDSSPGWLQDVTARASLDFTHLENRFFDYTREPLIPHQISTEGPALAVGDVNGDGLDDLYVGGAKWQPGQLFVQRANGTFVSGPRDAFRRDSLHEDVDAAFLDADNDGDLDLYVVSGGNEFWGEQEALLDRLYVNDGAGTFVRSRDALPLLYQNGSTVAPADFDEDGDVDLFVGSRVVSRRYGAIPPSYLLRNDGTGTYRDVTSELAPQLAAAGMVTSAAWLDHDGNGSLDLVIVGEWMPVRLFSQDGDRFVERTDVTGFAKTEGWWNTVVVADLNGDTRQDLVLGNLGLNSYVRASLDEPARLYVHDFARNGALEQILTFYKNGTSYPVVGRDELIRAIPRLSNRFPTFADFGDSEMQNIFSTAELRSAGVLMAHELASAIALNRGDGTFAMQMLPTEAQFAPIFAILPDDFNGDGHVDLIIGGNFFGVPPMFGRYDASYGLVLQGDGTGNVTPLDLEVSRFRVDGQIKGVAVVRGRDNEQFIAVARNSDRLQLWRTIPAGRR